jgi:hypothetical protein
MSVVIIGKKCPYCLKWRSPHEIMDIGGGVTVCLECWQWHEKAILMIASGEPPSGCPMCRRDNATLEAELGDRYTGMTVHRVDGIYQMACPECAWRLRPKQKDLYKGTAFGARNGLM